MIGSTAEVDRTEAAGSQTTQLAAVDGRRAQLPKTASPLPDLAMLGLGVFGLLAGLRLWRRVATWSSQRS